MILRTTPRSAVARRAVLAVLADAAPVAGQNGPPDLVSQSRDPFIPDPRGRKSPATRQQTALADVAEQARRNNEDLSRLLELTGQIHKTMNTSGVHGSDARVVRWLEDVEKTARRMRKRMR